MDPATVHEPCQPVLAGPSPETASSTRTFAGRAESVCEARRWVVGFLPASAATDAVVLMTSELFTNAIVHSASRLTGGLVTVIVRMGNGSVRIDVIDQGEAPPGVAVPNGLRAGVGIVSQLADVFGADGPDRWFTLRVGGPVEVEPGAGP